MLFSGVNAIFCVYLIFSATSLALQAFVSDVEQVENLSERGGLGVSVSLRCYVESESVSYRPGFHAQMYCFGQSTP